MTIDLHYRWILKKGNIAMILISQVKGYIVYRLGKMHCNGLRTTVHYNLLLELYKVYGIPCVWYTASSFRNDELSIPTATQAFKGVEYLSGT